MDTPVDRTRERSIDGNRRELSPDIHVSNLNKDESILDFLPVVSGNERDLVRFH